MTQADSIKALLQHLGEDPDREGLQETPQRYLRAWEDFTTGYQEDPNLILKTFEDGSQGYDELVFQGSIPFYSTCEHHLVAFFGMAHVGYIANGRIIGLSKIARLVDVFARRITVQERITVQIADALIDHLDPKGVGVVLQARHLCIESRGVRKPGTITTTSALRGLLKEHADARAEFMSMVSNGKPI